MTYYDEPSFTFVNSPLWTKHSQTSLEQDKKTSGVMQVVLQVSWRSIIFVSLLGLPYKPPPPLPLVRWPHLPLGRAFCQSRQWRYVATLPTPLPIWVATLFCRWVLGHSKVHWDDKDGSWFHNAVCRLPAFWGHSNPHWQACLWFWGHFGWVELAYPMTHLTLWCWRWLYQFDCRRALVGWAGRFLLARHWHWCWYWHCCQNCLPRTPKAQKPYCQAGR